MKSGTICWNWGRSAGTGTKVTMKLGTICWNWPSVRFNRKMGTKRCVNQKFQERTALFHTQICWDWGLFGGTGADLLELGLNYRLICKTCPFLLDLGDPKACCENFKKETHCYICRSFRTAQHIFGFPPKSVKTCPFLLSTTHLWVSPLNQKTMDLFVKHTPFC